MMRIVKLPKMRGDSAKFDPFQVPFGDWRERSVAEEIIPGNAIRCLVFMLHWFSLGSVSRNPFRFKLHYVCIYVC